VIKLGLNLDKKPRYIGEAALYIPLQLVYYGFDPAGCEIIAKVQTDRKQNVVWPHVHRANFIDIANFANLGNYFPYSMTQGIRS
jgi:hypothetical protein